MSIQDPEESYRQMIFSDGTEDEMIQKLQDTIGRVRAMLAAKGEDKPNVMDWMSMSQGYILLMECMIQMLKIRSA